MNDFHRFQKEKEEVLEFIKLTPENPIKLVAKWVVGEELKGQNLKAVLEHMAALRKAKKTERKKS
ncbi:MAG TPA: hypothetical protein VMW01_10440 [Williamwhitmania sp.]|nr:hypothetical protein [Williamwhitmania sp.]